MESKEEKMTQEEEAKKRRKEWKETLKKLDNDDLVHLFDEIEWEGKLTKEEIYRYTDRAYELARMKWECE